MLRAICDLGKSNSSCFSRKVGLDTDDDEKHEDLHPSFGFKANLIRLIGLLCYRNASNQDLVCTIYFLFIL